MISIDGAATERTPASIDVEGDVPHAMRLDLPGYVDVNTDVTIRGAETVTIRRDPQRLSP